MPKHLGKHLPKHQLKRLLGVLILLGAVGALAGAIYLAGQVVVYSGTGANFADALNVAPALPDGLAKRVHWRPDAPAALPGSPAARALEPVVRQQITDAYLRAWGQLDLSYQQGHPFGLATYFGGPLLVQVSEAVSATVAGPYAVRQASLGHDLALTFYSDDGSAVGFTDHAARFVQQFTGKDKATGDATQFVETGGVYDVAMVLEQGRWRVRAWRRLGDAPALAPPASTPGGLPGAVQIGGDGFTLNGQPWTIRGVNYYPSATPWTLFWPNYDPATTAADLARVASLGFNTVRIFVPYADFGGDTVDPAMLAHLTDFLNQAQVHGLKVIVTLFDHRTDHALDAWGADDLHLAGIVEPLAWHPAILAWDLKNEADRDAKANTPARNEAWLRHIAATVRRLDPNHLVTVGWSTPQDAAAAPSDFVDYVSYHYYADPAALPAQRAALAEAVAAFGAAKPIVLGEYGKSTWQWFLPQGYLEDRQAEYITVVRKAEAAGLSSGGDVVWTLYDFETVPLPEFKMPWQQATQGHMGILRVDGQEKPGALRP